MFKNKILNSIEKYMLPVKYPIITFSPGYANPATIMTCYDFMLPWLYNNCIQVSSFIYNNEFQGKTQYAQSIDYCLLQGGEMVTNNPWLHYNTIDNVLVDVAIPNILEFIIKCINNDYYVAILLDIRYINAYRMNRPEPHRGLIYGYNYKDQVIYYSDFIGSGRYQFAEMTFSEFEKSSSNLLSILSSMKESAFKKSFDKIFLLKPLAEGFYKFNIDLVVSQINDYILSRNTTKTIEKIAMCSYGLKIYDIFINYLNKVANEVFIDLRPYHFLIDHKHIVKLTVHYMNSQGYISEGNHIYQLFDELERDCLSIRNNILKYNVKNDENTLLNIKKSIEKMADKEEWVMIKFSNNILTNKFSTVSVHKENVLNHDNINIEYSDGWVNHEANGLIGTIEQNKYAIVVFLGNTIRFYATKDKNCGMVDIFIDGLKYSRVDLYSPDTIKRCLVYENDSITDGYHIIKIVNTGNKNDSSIGCKIILDTFEFTTKTNKVSEHQNFVEFIKIDNITKGNWPGIYGEKGYILFDQSNKLEPEHVKYLINYEKCMIHKLGYDDLASEINYAKDERALFTNRTKNKRSAFFVYNDSFNIGIIIFDGKVTFHLNNWNYSLRNDNSSVKVECWNDETGELLDTRIIKSNEGYCSGMYLSYRVKGAVRFNFSNPTRAGVYLQGVFWD